MLSDVYSEVLLQNASGQIFEVVKLICVSETHLIRTIVSFAVLLMLTVRGKVCHLKTFSLVLFNNNFLRGKIIWNQRLVKIQSRLSTTRPVITLIGCNAVGRASRFFFYLVYIF